MEEKKSRYKGYTKEQGKAAQRYKEKNLEEVRVSVRKGGKQALKDHAASLGMSVAEFVCEAVNEKAGCMVITSKKEE